MRPFINLRVPIIEIFLHAPHPQLDARSGFIDHVDRFVWQETIGNVPMRLVNSGFERVFGVTDLMKSLVTFADTFEDLDGLVLQQAAAL